MSFLKKAGGLLLGRTGSLDMTNKIVKSLRLVYGGAATVIIVTYYSAWRNERVEQGVTKFPFPGISKLRAKFAPSRSDDIPPGYGGPEHKGVMASGTGGTVISGSGKSGPPEYGGTRQVAEALVSGLPVRPSSTKRSTRDTSTGGVSDHWVGCQECYAIDNAGSVSQMDMAARAIISRLGGHYQGGELVYNVERNGFRIQVLYRTYTGGNHFDHIHVGVRKVGYEP